MRRSIAPAQVLVLVLGDMSEQEECGMMLLSAEEDHEE